jgi:hypothetical protein
MNKLGTKFGDGINKPTLMFFSKLLLNFKTHSHPSQKIGIMLKLPNE